MDHFFMSTTNEKLKTTFNIFYKPIKKTNKKKKSSNRKGKQNIGHNPWHAAFSIE